MSDWGQRKCRQDDTYEYDSHHGNATVTHKKGYTYFIVVVQVNVIPFNPKPTNSIRYNDRYLCSLTVLEIQGNSTKPEEWNIAYKDSQCGPFDPRALGLTTYNKLVETYGKETVIAAHLETSQVLKPVDLELIDALKEIARLYNKKLSGRKPKPSVDAAFKAVENGANSNLIVDDFGFRVLHYARFLITPGSEQSFTVPFVKFMIEHGANPKLGPRNPNPKANIYDGAPFVTPWHYFKEQDIMLANGPLHRALGGDPHGIGCCNIL